MRSSPLKKKKSSVVSNVWVRDRLFQQTRARKDRLAGSRGSEGDPSKVPGVALEEEGLMWSV